MPTYQSPYSQSSNFILSLHRVSGRLFSRQHAHLKQSTILFGPVKPSGQLRQIWSGGKYVSWCLQNRETPLRRIAQNRFELKLHCGTANPYKSLAAILAAGIDGLRKALPLVAGNCQDITSQTIGQQHITMGICAVIPGAQRRVSAVLQTRMG